MTAPLRVAFVTTHPIQYQAPVFRELQARPDVDLTVLFCQIPDAAHQGEGFGVGFEWDLPLLEGYPYEVLENVAAQPSVTTFRGCDTPDVGAVLRRHDFDAVIVNGWVAKSCLQTLAACRRLDIPCIVRGEANDLRTRPAWKRWLQARLVRRYAACCPIGSASRAFYLARGVPAERLFLAPYCVENERFARSAAAAGGQRAARERFGLPPEATVFLFSGKFISKKHPLFLLQALRLAGSGAAAAHLLMVGDGQLRIDCERFAAANQLPVTFTGFINQTQIPAAYAAADCLLLPSDAGETWGLVVNEAMACGRPALVSDQVGCGADLIVPASGSQPATGEVFPFGDVQGLADRLAYYAGRRHLLAAMGEAAKQRVAAYSPAAAAAGLDAAARAVARRPRVAQSLPTNSIAND